MPESTRGPFAAAPEELGKWGFVLSSPTSPQGVCVGRQPSAWEDKTQGWLKHNRRSTLPQGIASGVLLALPAKRAANLCSAQVTVGFTRGKIPPPRPTAPILLALGPKKRHTLGYSRYLGTQLRHRIFCLRAPASSHQIGRAHV